MVTSSLSQSSSPLNQLIHSHIRTTFIIVTV